MAPSSLQVDPTLRDLVPRPVTSDRLALRESIQREGRVLEPLRVRAGDRVILDGHTRHEEALRAQLSTVPIIEVVVETGTDLRNLVLTSAISRRHLTDWQRVRLACTFIEIERQAGRERMSAAAKRAEAVDAGPPHEDVGKVRDVVARKVGLGSGRQLDRGLNLVTSASAEVLGRLDAGEITIGAATRLARPRNANQHAAPQSPAHRVLAACAARLRPMVVQLRVLSRSLDVGVIKTIEEARAIDLLKEFLEEVDRIGRPPTTA